MKKIEARAPLALLEELKTEMASAGLYPAAERDAALSPAELGRNRPNVLVDYPPGKGSYPPGKGILTSLARNDA